MLLDWERNLHSKSCLIKSNCPQERLLNNLSLHINPSLLKTLMANWNPCIPCGSSRFAWLPGKSLDCFQLLKPDDLLSAEWQLGSPEGVWEEGRGFRWCTLVENAILSLAIMSRIGSPQWLRNWRCGSLLLWRALQGGQWRYSEKWNEKLSIEGKKHVLHFLEPSGNLCPEIGFVQIKLLYNFN